MAKLSDREKKAKQLGVAVNYKVSASKQGAPKVAYNMSKGTATVLKPAVKSTFDAQSKALKGYSSLPKGMSGPAAPKAILAKNYVTAQKKGYDTVSQEKGMSGPAMPYDLYKKKQRQINDEEADRLKKEADQAGRDYQEKKNQIKGVFSPSVWKEALKPKNLIKGFKKVGEFAYDVPKTAAREVLSAGLSTKYGKEKLGGKINPKEDFGKTGAKILGENPIGSYGQRFPKHKEFLKGLGFGEKSSNLAAPVTLAGSVAANVVLGGKGKTAKETVKGFFSKFSKSQGIKALNDSKRAITPEQAREIADGAKNITNKVDEGIKVKTARASDEIPKEIPKEAPRENIPGKTDKNVPVKKADGTNVERVDVESGKTKIKESQERVKKATDDYNNSSKDEFGNVNPDIKKSFDDAIEAEHGSIRKAYKDLTGEDLPEGTSIDEILSKLDEFGAKNERRFKLQDSERMSGKERFDNRNVGRPLKESVRKVGLLRRGKLGNNVVKVSKEGKVVKSKDTDPLIQEAKWKQYNEVLDKGQDRYNTKNPTWEKSRDKIILDNVISGNKRVGDPDSDMFTAQFKKEAQDAGLTIYDKGKWANHPIVARDSQDIQRYLKVKEGTPEQLDLLGINGKQAQGGRVNPALQEGTKKGLLTVAREKNMKQAVVKNFDPKSYVKEMKTAQKNAEGKAGLLSKVGSFLSEAKKKIVDSNAPIEDVIAQQQKKLNFESIPRYDMTNAIDRVYRSNSIAGEFARKNGLEDVIKKVDDLDEFDQYLIAKHGLSLRAEGIETGRDALKDKLLIRAVGDKYKDAEKVIRDYSHKLMDYAVESGLVSKDAAKILREKYPDYVPYNRIFGEDEAVSGLGRGRSVANLGKQTVVRGIKGSEREVQSPMRSFLERTAEAFNQGEKNKAAQILTSFHNLPDNPFGLEKVVGTKLPGDNTISVFKNGIKEVWKVDKDVAEAAKALNVQQLGILGKIFAAPIRVAKIGITGMNLPFVAANIARDIVSAAINSKHPLRSLIAMPQALFEAVGHQKLFKEMTSEGALQTSFDIARNQIAPTIRDTRGLLKNKGIEKVKYIASTPAKLFRAAEDIIGRSEELNRISQYKGAYDAAIAKGMQPIDARAVAARAARENSVNFARKGEFGQAMNVLVLYLNAGIQGSRTLVRNIKTRPVATSAKIATVVGMPLAITTSWNLSDPKRKAAYEDIPEYEKENNFILIPDNPTQDENGKWNVIKVPIQPGLSNLVQPIRYALERASGLDPQSLSQIASQLTGAVSPVQVPVDLETASKTANQLIPQALKPTIEAKANKNFFTGAPIVPRRLEGLSPELQVKDNTSGTSMLIGKRLGVSPLQVEQFIKGTFGSVGLQVLNASDNALAKTGKISPEDIGGQKVFEAVFARFGKAQGGAIENAEWEKKNKEDIQRKSENFVKQKAMLPKYEEAKALLESGNEDEYVNFRESLSEEDQKTFKTVQQSERKKFTNENKEKLKPLAQQIKSLAEQDKWDEAEKMFQGLSKDEQRVVENILDEK